MSVAQKFFQFKISAKLSGMIATSLVALCVMSAIAVYGTKEVQSLGETLYEESVASANIRAALELNIERATGEVHAAPAELDLAKLKDSQQTLLQLLTGIKKSLNDQVANATAENIKAASQKILGHIATLETVSTKVYDQANSFAGAEASNIVKTSLVPLETALHEALKDFKAASDANANAQIAMIQETSGFIKNLVIALAILLVSIIALLGYAIVSRGVVKPITDINDVMKTLSGGDSAVAVPYATRFDEIGDMARAVEIFKNNMIETDKMRAQQEETKRQAEEDKRASMNKLAADFETAVGGIVKSLATAATEMQTAAQSMSASSEETSRQATAVAAASEEASTNVQTVASAAEELTASVAEISQQVANSSKSAGKAVEEAAHTDVTVQGLAEAAQKIGDVVALISDIASQTNLLALNATIEAARAGDAGKGFAVVATEVKALATQTAKATEEISQQIAAIQASTGNAVGAIKGIGETISGINEIATTIAAAVEEQGAATREIARNVTEAARGTSEVSSNITGVTRASGETGAAATQVLGAAGELSKQATNLRTQVDRFLVEVRAA